MLIKHGMAGMNNNSFRVVGVLSLPAYAVILKNVPRSSIRFIPG